MIPLKFLNADGALLKAGEAAPGDRLLEVAQNFGLPVEGACEGSMACSTCHVILRKDQFSWFPEPSQEEEDLLDFAAGVRPTSRLACQLRLEARHAGLEVTLPPGQRNLLGS